MSFLSCCDYCKATAEPQAQRIPPAGWVMIGIVPYVEEAVVIMPGAMAVQGDRIFCTPRCASAFMMLNSIDTGDDDDTD